MDGGRIIHSRSVNFFVGLKTVDSVTIANPAIVTVTGHGFPDFTTPAAAVFCHPLIYFDNMVGMTELQGNVYQARWIDANTFSLATKDGVLIDSTLFQVRRLRAGADRRLRAPEQHDHPGRG